ncbi:hypothetical protein [Spirosoma sp. 209]|uniref:hypothetical protein n=1 Tax=Spirosoma sp. 209 TaxID=1955701 RepID=UPI001F2312A4|nr:hypothetical protein [Spirosoma sp. 209]
MNDSTKKPAGSDDWETDFQRWGKRSLPEPRPFFYTRLQARLAQSGESAGWLPWWLRRPAYAYAALSLLIVLNAGAVIRSNWITEEPAGPDLALSEPNRPDQATADTDPILDDYDIDPITIAYE